MRAAPPLQVSLQRFDTARGAVRALGALGVAATLAWTLSHDRPIPPGPICTALLATALIGWLGRGLTRIPATGLRWDGADWYLTRAPAEPVQGRLGVAIDLGPWMLLHFVPATGVRWRDSIWLPAQRRGLEGEWHGLRCALYSPRPPVLPAAHAPRASSVGREP